MELGWRVELRQQVSQRRAGCPVKVCPVRPRVTRLMSIPAPSAQPTRLPPFALFVIFIGVYHT